MKISRVEFKNGAVYDHAASRALIQRLRAMASELDMIRQSGTGVLYDAAHLMNEAAIWISIMTDNFMEEDGER